MSDSKFSLILLHDDGRTRRMRMTRGMYRALLAGLVLLPLFGLFGLWAGYEGWRSLRAWQAEKVAFQTRIDALQVQVERLSALEAILDPRAAASLAPAVSMAASPTNEAPRSEPAKPAPARPDAAPAPEPAGDNAPAAVAGSPEQRGAVDTGVIRMENLRAALVDSQRLRAGADLHVANTNGRQVSGKILFSLLTADGRQFPLVNEDPAFRISRFKKVATLSPLPLPAVDLRNASVIVEVLVGDKLVYRDFCPIEERPAEEHPGQPL